MSLFSFSNILLTFLLVMQRLALLVLRLRLPVSLLMQTRHEQRQEQKQYED